MDPTNFFSQRLGRKKQLSNIPEIFEKQPMEKSSDEERYEVRLLWNIFAPEQSHSSSRNIPELADFHFISYDWAKCHRETICLSFHHDACVIDS
jgi:hypothetical protein